MTHINPNPYDAPRLADMDLIDSDGNPAQGWSPEDYDGSEDAARVEPDECYYCNATLHRPNEFAIWLDANGGDTCPRTMYAHTTTGYDFKVRMIDCTYCDGTGQVVVDTGVGVVIESCSCTAGIAIRAIS